MIARDGQDPGPVGSIPVGGAEVATLPGRSPEASRDDIQVDMARTRAELGNTIDAIQERLNPQRLKEQVADSVREATIGKVEHAMNKVELTAREARSGFVDTIRNNPIPAVLVGVGLTWLFFSGSERNGHTQGSYPRYQTNANSGQIKDTAQQLANQAGSQVQRLGQQAQDLGNQARDQIGNLSGQVQETVEQVGSQAQEQVAGLQSDVQGQVRSFTTDLQQQTHRLSYTFERAMRQNPLSIGAVALALGAAVGLAAPEVPHEDELIGDARLQVKQKAHEAAHQALENVQKIADQVQTAAEDPNKSL
jgi:hypothetical protein